MKFIDQQPVPLWSGTAPLALGNDPEDNPTLTVFYPRQWRSTRKAVVVLPGGGYACLCQHEGYEYAKWLADNGYTGIVCNYRVHTAEHPYHHPVMISDAARAIRVVRAHAEELGIDPHKIGIMGSSAGGHLAASCATHHEIGLREEGESTEKDLGRPDFTILCYGVLTFGEYTHVGTRTNLLGATPDPALVDFCSMEKSADSHTPRAFIWHTWEDQAVPVQNSLLYAARLKEMGVHCDVHIYERGVHGIGLAGGHPWTTELLRWLEQV